MNRIYISYNPEAESDKQLANDLYRVGSRNDFIIYLPERNRGDNQVSEQTKHNIRAADWIVVFSTTDLSKEVSKELSFAVSSANKKPESIIVVYGYPYKKITGPQSEKFKPYWVDFSRESANEVLNTIIGDIKKENQSKKENNALKTILGIGLGLLMLNQLSKSSQ